MNINNTIYIGDSEEVLKDIDSNSIGLVVTSPPYFRMRNEISYDNYNSYLKKMFRIAKQLYRVIDHRRIVAINCSDYMENGVKYPVPFDIHRLLRRAKFTYRDDIIWQKPEGMSNSKRAGIVMQNPYPMYYAPDLVYEHILIFSKGKKGGYDHVRREDSKIDIMKYRPFFRDVWKMNPQARNVKDLIVHNSAYPIILPEMITRFYSYKNDVVLDPFFGHGTTMQATTRLHRSCIGIELFREREHAIKHNVRYGQTTLSGSINWNTVYHPSANNNPLPKDSDTNAIRNQKSSRK
jgi:DNA modification methylase